MGCIQTRIHAHTRHHSSCQAVLSIKLGGKYLGVSLPVKISDIKIIGVLRVHINMVQRFPWAGTLNLCFAQKPDIDLELNVLQALNVRERLMMCGD